MCIVLVLTSTQSSLWIKDVPSKSDRLGHYLLVKSHFFGIVQGVAHKRGAKDVLHGLTQVRFITHQGQSCVDIVFSNLPHAIKIINQITSFPNVAVFYFYLGLAPDSWQC